MLKYEGYQSTTEIDARLSELEEEKIQLLALRKQLQQPSPITSDSNSYTPEQKIAIFKGFEGERIYLLTAGKINKAAVATL